jgi:hypothetical protein
VRVAGEELKEEMYFIKVQMSAPRNNDIMWSLYEYESLLK